jgi:hypothetical protein
LRRFRHFPRNVAPQLPPWVERRPSLGVARISA